MNIRKGERMFSLQQMRWSNCENKCDCQLFRLSDRTSGDLNVEKWDEWALPEMGDGVFGKKRKEKMVGSVGSGAVVKVTFNIDLGC